MAAIKGLIHFGGEKTFLGAYSFHGVARRRQCPAGLAQGLFEECFAPCPKSSFDLVVSVWRFVILSRFPFGRFNESERDDE